MSFLLSIVFTWETPIVSSELALVLTLTLTPHTNSQHTFPLQRRLNAGSPTALGEDNLSKLLSQIARQGPNHKDDLEICFVLF